MAEFLDTDDAISGINKIIKRAKKFLIIISPYIDIKQRFKLLIQEKNDEGVQVVIVYGKKRNQFKLDKETKSWINSMENVSFHFEKKLHAKCYFNEEEALVSSMNFYEASEKNIEMSLLLDRIKDSRTYHDLFQEIKRIINGSEVVYEAKKELGDKGHCIRCSGYIELNVNKPYCKKHYNSWKVYSDEEYEEDGFCHICGEEEKVSMKKPCCLNCYRKNKNLFK